MQVVSVVDGGAWCESRGERQHLDLMLVGEQATGTWVLAFRGSAVRVLTTEEAMQTTAALDALQAALAGARDFDMYFSDLVDREPPLPFLSTKAT